ncbi:hypothetical protein E6O75_ATG10851 [Venturia nashicola]|uniref:Uncharacterized protein n=1 Tax=Venturia nashicola TaxID=86259 RepID=A0A4Z1P0T9_9PEZI|nr:hypothetical protein E6O75_ATG10851 [Venturia nashicola]
MTTPKISISISTIFTYIKDAKTTPTHKPSPPPTTLPQDPLPPPTTLPQNPLPISTPISRPTSSSKPTSTPPLKFSQNTISPTGAIGSTVSINLLFPRERLLKRPVYSILGEMDAKGEREAK